MDKAKPFRLLFISRAYPPVTGGIENQNYELSVWLGKVAETRTIANRHGKKFLPCFLPGATLKALFLMRHYDALLLGDGVLGITGWIVKLFHHKPVICVVHGLDLTFRNSFYQKFWPGYFLRRMDKLIAVGNETVRVAEEKGIAPEKVVFIPNGIDPNKFFHPASRSELEEIIGMELRDRNVLLTSGRLARRKGVAWFCEHVMPELPERFIYVVAGDGPDRKNIEETIIRCGLGQRVKVLGYVSDRTRDILFNTCDIFIQPNIKVPGDMEGFGISVIEAASCGIPVIASALEGLKDAVKDGENGFLVDPEDTEGYLRKILELSHSQEYRHRFGTEARKYVIENNSWEKISQMYLEQIRNTRC